MKYVIAVIVVVVLILLYFLVTYNKLVTMRNSVHEAFATMDVYLKRRWDLIPNLVETVKGYAKHEQETLKQITGLRGGSYDSLSDDQKVQTNNALTKGIMKIMAIAEAYPELKANTNFMALNNELANIEKDIAQSRKYYNAVVKEYNNKVQMIPSNIVAGIAGFKSAEMFAAAEAERANVKVQF